MPTITVHDTEITYRLIRTRQNRHLRLTVSSNTGVRVSAPRNCPETAMHALVREKAEWILQKLAEYDEQRRCKPRLEFRDGSTLSIHGEPHTLIVQVWDKSIGKVRLESRALQIQVPPTKGDSAPLVRQLCEGWLRSYGRWFLQRRIMELGVPLELVPTRISVRRQTSKWGSCTAKGSISLNMLLVCIPPELCDYVLIHELAHLRELNHSKRFWDIVEQGCPDFRQYRNALRAYSWLLDPWDESSA